MDEANARRIVLVQAFDAADSPLWTAEDSAWASQLAVQTTPIDAPDEHLLTQRAHHALQRLVPRDRDLQRWLVRPSWRWRWLLIAAVLGAVIGLAADLLGRQAVVDLLAPPVWAVVLWNLAIYANLLVIAVWPSGRLGGAIRRAFSVWWQRGAGSGPLRAATARWAALSAPLVLARIAALLHIAAAAVAGGLIAGMYLRGLVFDFRVGWQSTFLDAVTVRQLLAGLLAPASALTGIAIPDATTIEAMRLTPAALNANASAAPWIHLYATTLALFVTGPRIVLALASLIGAGVQSRHFVLPMNDPTSVELLRRHRGGQANVLVLPYASSASAQAALGLRAILARAYGNDLELRLAEVTPVGDEDSAVGRVAAGAATLHVALVDLGATPEPEHHGRFVTTLKQAAPTVPLLLLVDEAAFRRRFGAWPQRLDERRTAWRRLAEANGVGTLFADLDTPDPVLAEGQLKQALAP